VDGVGVLAGELGVGVVAGVGELDSVVELVLGTEGVVVVLGAVPRLSFL
jgi:hypothetical protein